jgi:hypothetical protein
MDRYMKKWTCLAVCLPPLLFSGGCELQKTENPLSPMVAGPIPGVEISPPKTLEPATGWQIPGNRQPLTLLIENASSNGPRPLNYLVEVATDAGFTNIVFAREGIQPGEGGRTVLTLPDALGAGRTYYWRARAQDGANTSHFSEVASFNLFTPVSFGQAVPISPANNEKTSSLAPEFRFLNAPRVGNPGPINYTLEIATNDSFANRIIAWQFPEQPGGDSHFLSASGLPPSTQLFWRVRAVEATALGPWSNTAVFRTPAPVLPPTPPPDVPPGVLPPGGACAAAGTHLGVVECRRKQYGHMDRAQTYQFLRQVASDLNAGNYPGAKFGIYRKPSGNNCMGYSCDIICSASGGVWDVLSDWDNAQNPIWLYKGIAGEPACEVVP